MNELENIVKSVVYGGIGAAATLVEKGSDLARALVEKGQETVRNNQETADDIKRRVKEFCDHFVNDNVIDVSTLTRDQRDELRRQLDELEAEDAEAVRAETDDDVPVCQPEECAEEPAEATYTAPDEE